MTSGPAKADARRPGTFRPRPIRELLASGGAAAASHPVDPARGVLRFGLPVLQHIERARVGARSLSNGRRQAALHEPLEEVLVERIAADLRRVGRGREAVTASEADGVFRALVLPAVAGFVGPGARVPSNEAAIF